MSSLVKKGLILSLALLSSAAFSATPLSEQTKVKAFIKQMVREDNFNAQELDELFDKVKLKPSIVKAMDRPYEAKPWRDYRGLFVNEKNIRNGVAFWDKYKNTLELVQQHYRIDPAIVIATIGIESAYGKRLGQYRVIDALSTLAFDYPRRAAFFTKELKEFLLLTRENNLDPLSIKGSYAGAIGQAQFMPSSFRQYAVDFSGDNKIDLSHNEKDVIASIANYYQENGWRPGKPVAVKAKLKGEAYKEVPYKKGRPSFALLYLKKHGITPASGKYSRYLKAKLITLEGKDGPEHWLGFTNFYVITRYNPSNLYAMAVYQLASAIKKAHNE